MTEYRDEATGLMAENPGKPGRFVQVELRPRVVVHESSSVAMAIELHERAHELCYIANSVNFPVGCTPVVTAAVGVEV